MFVTPCTPRPNPAWSHLRRRMMHPSGSRSSSRYQRERKILQPSSNPEGFYHHMAFPVVES